MCFAFKISAIKEYFYHLATIIVAEFGNCKKILAMFPNLETLPKSEVRFQIRKRFRIPKFPDDIRFSLILNTCTFFIIFDIFMSYHNFLYVHECLILAQTLS